MISSPRSWVRSSAAQPLGVPSGLELERAAVLVLQVAQSRAEVGCERRELARWRDRADQALAAQQRLRTGDPAAPTQLRDHDRDQRDHPAEPRDQEDQVAAGVLTAPGDEAQVVQQHEVGDRLPGVVDHRMDADVRRSARDLDDRRIGNRRQARCVAGERGRVVLGVREKLPAARAQADGDQPLVLGGAREERHQPPAIRVGEGFGDRIRERVGEELAARVEIAREPAQRQAVHQRQRQIRGHAERQQQRY